MIGIDFFYRLQLYNNAMIKKVYKILLFQYNIFILKTKFFLTLSYHAPFLHFNSKSLLVDGFSHTTA